MVLAAIPSPSRGVVHLGPIPLRAYALMIILGIIVAVVVTSRRLRARGVDPVVASEVAYWAVPFGIVGARLYHIISTPEPYFGADGHLLGVFEVWNGGLAIWGAVAGGALGAWIACRRMNVPYGLFADAMAPGLVLAQAIGRWGNYFNQELYGRPTNLPWALEIDPAHQVIPGVSRYEPTFLYESLWDVGVAVLLLLVDRHRRLGRGRLFFLYVATYTIGRLWIEAMRIDAAEKLFGLRINIWVALVVFLLALAALVFVRRPVDPPIEWTEPGALDGPEAALAGARPGSESGALRDGAAEDSAPSDSASRGDPAGDGAAQGGSGSGGPGDDGADKPTEPADARASHSAAVEQTPASGDPTAGLS